MLLFTVLALGGAVAHAEPARFDHFSYSGLMMARDAVGSGEYRNPIVAGYYPDPSITRVGDDFYLVNSTFAHFPGVPVFTSRDLVHWVQIGNAIDRPGQLDFTGLRTSQGVFAPDISWHDGTFYIVNTCVACGGNFVITASNPAGPWSDPVWLPFDGIDPSLYWEGDKAYIVNNRPPAEPARYDGHRAIWMQEFDWRAGKMTGPATQIVNGGVDIAKKPVWIEGPHIFRKDGYYYLTAAEGGTSVNHSQVVFRSKKLRGPYVPFADNPILTQRDLDPARPDPVGSAGHAKLIRTPTGEWWATFLAVQPYKGDFYNTGRETFLLPVTWKKGWPVILPHGQAIPRVSKVPRLPAQPPLSAQPAPFLPTSGDFSYVDAFDGSRLSMQWIGIRTPHRPFYTVAGGALELASGPSLGNLNGVPVFMGRRQQHAIATVSTVLHFEPGTSGDRAGLAAVQSDRNNIFFGLTRIGTNKVVALYQRDGTDTDQLLASAPLDGSGPLTLTIEVRGDTMTFDYAVDGKRHTLKSGLDATFLSTEKAGGFVGTVIGPCNFAGEPAT